MAEMKVTKRDMYEEIMAVASEREDIVEFCKTQIAQLDAKAEKAKERAAKKAAEADELYDAVMDVLTDELMTIDDIMSAIEFEGVTRSKVVFRLTKGIKAEIVEKSYVKEEDKKVTAYRKIA